MRIELTKEEFDVLITLIDEALQMISLKNFYGIKIDEKYNIETYDRIRFYKLNLSVEKQRLSNQKEEENFCKRIFDINNKKSYLEFCDKISNNKKLKEMYQMEMLKTETIFRSWLESLDEKDRKKFIDEWKKTNN